jgi:polar amino acid transport system permease protein
MVITEVAMALPVETRVQGDIAPPPRTGGLIATALIGASAVIAFTAWAACNAAPQMNAMGSVAAFLAAAATGFILLPAVVISLVKAFSSAAAWRRGEITLARSLAQKSRDLASISIGLSIFLTVVTVLFFFVTVTDGAIRETFLKGELIRTSLPETARAFGINVALALGAEALALAMGLLLALGRLVPGRGMAPVRLLAVGYIDLFRGLPSVVVIYLICFGIPLAEIQIVSGASPVVYAIIALAMTHAAYNAEVFRAGIESIHPSQYSTALSLGLTPWQAMSRVVLPQGIARVVPPLLSGFVALQKDTALVNVVGIVDSFAQAKIYAANYYNLSAVTTVCILFVLITIPQTRFVDYMIARRASNAKVGSP